MTNNISIIKRDIAFLKLFIIFTWGLIVLMGVCEYGYLRGKQKEMDRSMSHLEMNLATHRH